MVGNWSRKPGWPHGQGFDSSTLRPGRLPEWKGAGLLSRGRVHARVGSIPTPSAERSPDTELQFWRVSRLFGSRFKPPKQEGGDVPL